MPALTASSLRGTWSTLLLPVNEDNSIDFELLSAQIDRLIQLNVDGIYCNGTAGEFDNQTEADFDRIGQLLANACHAAAMPFQIGASHTSPVMARQRVRRAVMLRPGAIQLILPDWSPPTNQEAITFLRTMAAEASGLGLVLYNPPHARRQLTPPDFAMLKEAIPSLIGIKVLGGESAWYEEMNRLVPDLSIFIAGHLLAEGTRFGARGSYSNMACLHPRAARNWHCLMTSDMAAALELGTRIQTFLAVLILTTF